MPSDPPSLSDAPLSAPIDASTDAPLEGAGAAGVAAAGGVLGAAAAAPLLSSDDPPPPADLGMTQEVSTPPPVEPVEQLPSQGTLTLPGGQTHQLVRSTVIGRAPEIHADVVAGTADAIRIDDGELSRTHFRFVLSDGNVLVEDLGSTNGSSLGAGTETMALEAHVAVRLVASVDVHVGTTVIGFQPA